MNGVLTIELLGILSDNFVKRWLRKYIGTSAIKRAESSDNKNLIFMIKFKFFHPFGGFMPITLIKRYW